MEAEHCIKDYNS